MKIRFSNLGSIKETTLDLKPLSVIIGPNNSNKTYVAYSIYGLLKLFRDFSRLGVTHPFNIKPTDDGTFICPIDASFWTSFESLTEEVAKGFKSNLTNFFQDSSGKLFAGTAFTIDVSRPEIEAALNRILEAGIIGQWGNQNLTISRDNDVLTIKVELAKSKAPERGPISRSFVGFFFLFQILRNLVTAPFLLPAERNSFIITYKMLGNRRYKLLRETQRGLLSGGRIQKRQLDLLKEQGDIRYPEPIEDFLEFLEDTELQKNVRIDSKKETEFQKLADLIELHIQNKNKTNLTPTRLGGREIKISVKRGLNIDLYNASSSIKQLAPLLLYLRYRANENDLLIIDEPEMNLHPESQAKLLEVFAILVNQGISVLLTTHSPYFMSHLNNLVIGPDDAKSTRRTQARTLFLSDERAFLSDDQIGAYEMKDNRLNSLKDPDYGFRWDTLSNVSSEIQQKFFEINGNGEAPKDTKNQ